MLWVISRPKLEFTNPFFTKYMLIFPKYLEYALPSFIVLWRSFLWHQEANSAPTRKLFHSVASQVATEQIFSTKKSTALTFAQFSYTIWIERIKMEVLCFSNLVHILLFWGEIPFIAYQKMILFFFPKLNQRRKKSVYLQTSQCLLISTTVLTIQRHNKSHSAQVV